jgi:pimeloyl-ACP methyl ester carboxylesterase
MPIPSPYVREAGSGPGVICIHSNASSSAQWRGLMDMLSPNHLVLAPDSYGSGKSPDWHPNFDTSAPVSALASDRSHVGSTTCRVRQVVSAEPL